MESLVIRSLLVLDSGQPTTDGTNPAASFLGPSRLGLVSVASRRAAPLPFRVGQCPLVSGGAPTTAYSCELTPEEQKRDTRYTGASLPDSEDWIEQLRRNLDGV